jgi:hypothetical protein
LVERSKDNAQAGLAGWAVAAAIVDRLHEFSLADGSVDVAAILGPALSDLSESELEELAKQITGPLMDTPRRLLRQYVRAWRLREQFRTEGRPTGDIEV